VLLARRVSRFHWVQCFGEILSDFIIPNSWFASEQMGDWFGGFFDASGHEHFVVG